jgi:hypothetical protein
VLAAGEIAAARNECEDSEDDKQKLEIDQRHNVLPLLIRISIAGLLDSPPRSLLLLCSPRLVVLVRRAAPQCRDTNS